MRLIDADPIIKFIDMGHIRSPYEKSFSDSEVIDMLETAPTIDAVEVVRCKDCKHRDPEDKKCDCGHDIMWQLPRADEWFCADGEEKERSSK